MKKYELQVSHMSTEQEYYSRAFRVLSDLDSALTRFNDGSFVTNNTHLIHFAKRKHSIRPATRLFRIFLERTVFLIKYSNLISVLAAPSLSNFGQENNT